MGRLVPKTITPGPLPGRIHYCIGSFDDPRPAAVRVALRAMSSPKTGELYWCVTGTRGQVRADLWLECLCLPHVRRHWLIPEILPGRATGTLAVDFSGGNNLLVYVTAEGALVADVLQPVYTTDEQTGHLVLSHDEVVDSYHADIRRP